MLFINYLVSISYSQLLSSYSLINCISDTLENKLNGLFYNFLQIKNANN
jgi:hypothetical protein